MKRPYFTLKQRVFLLLNREDRPNMIGAQLELKLAWKKLQRSIFRVIWKK